ncbi:MAG: hypothetical protein JO165_10405 [Candidatus Eremiobacteraeota bacterium]|nr:hypothetical protein [Candidatus Eremiobacteraeota bacterium]
MQKGKLFALAAVAALLAACSSNGASLSPAAGNLSPQSAGELTLLSAFTARNNTTGETIHIYPTRDVFSAFAVPAPGHIITQGELNRGNSGKPAGTASNLNYYGGPVQTAPALYLIKWGNWSSTGDPDGVGARLQAFYGVIGGSGWLNTVTQYTQSGGAHVGNSGNIFVSTWNDTSTPPRRPTQSQLAAEASKAAAHFGNYSASASYVIALPTGKHPSGFGTQYCAWHSSTSASGGVIAYTNLPYMPDAGASCGANSVNSNGTLDGVTIVGGHEQAETETDPQPNSGWLDSSGSEIGDKCAWISLENNPNAGGYPTQPLWSNASSGCVQSY